MRKFKRVYFRINTPSYYNQNKYGVGFKDEEASQHFQSYVTELFLNDGWVLKEKRMMSGSCNTVIKDRQELYLHPQSFSGIVLKDNIKYIEQLLNDRDLFKFEKTDIYEDVFDITDDEYLNILKIKQTEIEKDILEEFKTKRRNLYKTSVVYALDKILDKYRIKRINHYVGVYSSNDIDSKFILKVFDKLVDEGKIVTAETKNGIGYRTINKTEQKELGICLA